MRCRRCPERLGDLAFDLIEGLTEVIVLMKRRKGRLVGHRIVIHQVAQLIRNGDRPSTAAGVIIFDDDFDVWQVFLYGGFEVGKADGLEAHVGIVKVLDRRLNHKTLSVAREFSSKWNWIACSIYLTNLYGDFLNSIVPSRLGFLEPETMELELFDFYVDDIQWGDQSSLVGRQFIDRAEIQEQIKDLTQNIKLDREARVVPVSRKELFMSWIH